MTADPDRFTPADCLLRGRALRTLASERAVTFWHPAAGPLPGGLVDGGAGPVPGRWSDRVDHGDRLSRDGRSRHVLRVVLPVALAGVPTLAAVLAGLAAMPPYPSERQPLLADGPIGSITVPVDDPPAPPQPPGTAGATATVLRCSPAECGAAGDQRTATATPAGPADGQDAVPVGPAVTAPTGTEDADGPAGSMDGWDGVDGLDGSGTTGPGRSGRGRIRPGPMPGCFDRINRQPTARDGGRDAPAGSGAPGSALATHEPRGPVCAPKWIEADCVLAG